MSSFAPDRVLNQTSKHSNTNIWLKSVNSLEISGFLTWLLIQLWSNIYINSSLEWLLWYYGGNNDVFELIFFQLTKAQLKGIVKLAITFMPMTSVCIILTTSVISSSNPKCVPVAWLIVPIRKIFKVKPQFLSLKLNNKETFFPVCINALYELIFSNHNPFSGMSNDFWMTVGKLWV